MDRTECVSELGVEMALEAAPDGPISGKAINGYVIENTSKTDRIIDSLV